MLSGAILILAREEQSRAERAMDTTGMRERDRVVRTVSKELEEHLYKNSARNKMGLGKRERREVD